ncbi:aspartate ammonia-lyase [Clostridium saccharoperbutylacetonicum]|uniref:aspartate ammonia-lyase n=1 Tax=Clostridium saccharoperbutylacetonicum N1-4(HMT) TaxID=931276 RepID=M1MTE0_9CLOT|nr:aspartate ammonia-lyase [Clostridium saccharoperbutylacetonicum]AGF57986.1 aspartate ammonia-lyase AnsB [Clostridium saccharoperbutylacetonicum N1-4(HMT)]NRT61241.1 aspartate ammonia-lyase [Clostridium saccharoperbutylacetonicum]NSB24558.1 aspartate ammonia-lyase [Clostridium saccharoperbutylacetonicum]NSB43933.1 aspartate ammonia-lyase [Clostridium saccharoperbutylacetonicum]
MKMRMESDSIGNMEVPVEAYYGIQSLRASRNFNITKKPLHKDFIISLAEIKKAAAITNRDAELLTPTIANAIVNACEEIISGKFHDQFIVDPIQGGAGTSANMNANEVIANRAIELLGEKKGSYNIIHPNDHVNMAQSTNDVFPTAGKLTVLKMLPKTISELQRLYNALKLKSLEFNNVIKMGRTQLQDAVPIRLGQSFNAFASMIKRDVDRLKSVEKEMLILNIGGTAIGTSINVCPEYLTNITPNLKKVCGFDVVQSKDLIDATQNLDCFVAVSGILKTCAVNLSKMANDLRLLSSGPKTGFGEINLPSMQNGSSIMPGKINPVILEVVSQVAFNIIGNDFTITMAAEAGQLELNAFEPVLFHNLFESIETLENATTTLIDNCILGITANEDRCKELLNSSVGIVTALCPYIGYKKSADIAKTSLKNGTSIKELVLNEGILTSSELDAILDPFSMTDIDCFSDSKSAQTINKAI